MKHECHSCTPRLQKLYSKNDAGLLSSALILFKADTGCKCVQDIEDRDLTYAMMAKLSLAAAEEHMGKLAKDAGIVALYAKVNPWPSLT